jgi:outer membrane protein
MRRCLVLSIFELAALLLAAMMWGQTTLTVPSAPSAQMAVTSSSKPFDVKEYAKPKLHFPDPINPYTTRDIAPANLSNTPTIERLMHDGKVYLSISDAIAIAIENNLDIAIARYNLNIADTDIWRAKAGSGISGVNSGVVQNTPSSNPIGGQITSLPVAIGGGGEASSVGGGGGQVGSGQGGTSIAAGGAGAGAGGLVSSTLGSGPQPSSFDPIVTGTFQLDRSSIGCNTPLCATKQNLAGADFSYAQGFHWGTDMAITFNSTRVSSNGTYDFLNPVLNSSFQFKLTQHLLQGRGFAVNTRFIKIAKNNREISDAAFRLQIISTVNQIESMYWNLVYAHELAKVQKEQLALAQKTLELDKVQVDIGSLEHIEVVRAQTAIAADEQSLTTAVTDLELQQLLMKNALSRSLVDPVLVDAEVIPTSTMEMPAEEKIAPTQDLVDEAFHHRPDLAEARINLVNNAISNKAVRNALLPSLDLSAFYGGAGLGGSSNSASICYFDPQLCGLKTPPSRQPPISFGETLNQLVDSSLPDKGIQLSLSVPLRNRTAQATQVRSELEYRQAQLRLQQLENEIRIEVRNAQFGVQQNRLSVTAARAATELGRQALDYEQKKFEIHASTSIQVLQAHMALTQAEATLLSAKISYERAELELDRATGLLLEHAGIRMADAERGEVTHGPTIPHAVDQPVNLRTPN